MEENVRLLHSFLMSNANKYPTITSSVQKKLDDISSSFSEIIKERNKALSQLKETKFTISNIVNKLGWSNKTIYNNAIYLDFCKFCIAQMKQEADEAYRSKYKNPDQLIELLKGQVNAMVDKDIENQQLKKELATAKAELARYYQDVKNSEETKEVKAVAYIAAKNLQ